MRLYVLLLAAYPRKTNIQLSENQQQFLTNRYPMLDKYVWRVLFLALFATASLAIPSITSSGPSCHDGVPHELERAHLRNLRMEPGQESSLILGDTKYEQLTCIGFNSTLGLLSATIEIKLPSGFGGGLCTKGSFEYVRFWVSYDNVMWKEIGLAMVNTHDILNSLDCKKQPTKPLIYTLSIRFTPDRKPCQHPVLPQIRATLSWNALPPINPFGVPMRGNSLQETIQSPLIPPPPTVMSTGLESNLSIDHECLPDDVGEGYSDRCTPDQEVFDIGRTQDPDAELAATANVDFEELTCLGLDWGLRSLVATVRVKQKQGYSATPCQNHRFEYVSFWADWNDNCEWVFLGTTKFNVHDFSTSPGTGLVYTALMPVDVSKFSAPCNQAKIARVRAALAFNQVPPEPPVVAPRGNYIEKHVHLKPHDRIDLNIPGIHMIGNVPLQLIQTAPDIPNSGMTLPNAFVVGRGLADPSHANRPCPFGGKIVITGESFIGHSYRLMARPYPPPLGDLNYPGLPVIQSVDFVDLLNPDGHEELLPSAEGYFKYRHPLNNQGNVLSWWYPQQSGNWQIRLEMAQYSQMTNKYEHEGYSPWYNVLVNLVGPSAYLDIEGTECNGIKIDKEITGKFTATSPYLGDLT